MKYRLQSNSFNHGVWVFLVYNKASQNADETPDYLFSEACD